jgi:hypothetical protein
MLSLYPRISPFNFRIAKLIFMKRGTYIIVTGPISTAYFINPAPQ